jgi:hypothetical protein
LRAHQSLGQRVQRPAIGRLIQAQGGCHRFRDVGGVGHGLQPAPGDLRNPGRVPARDFQCQARFARAAGARDGDQPGLAQPLTDGLGLMLAANERGSGDGQLTQPG